MLPPGLLLQELARLQQDNADLREQLFQLEALRVQTAHRPAPPHSQAASSSPPPPDSPPERLRLAIQAAELAVWDWDLTQGMVYLSSQWGAITGTACQDTRIPIEGLLAQVHLDDVALVRQELQRLLRGESLRYAVEHRVRTAKGWIWIESMGLAQAWDERGRITRIIGTNADITPRKQVQEQLAIAQSHAEQASRAKSEFLANMSHEVRTPLSTLMGLTRLLQRTPINNQQKEYLGLMDNSATALLALLNDILDLSKIEAGKLVFEQVRFDLLNWVEQATAPFEAQMRDKGLAFYVDDAPSLPHYVVGDPGRLRQVLSNLMSNAVKFTDKGSIQVKVWPDAEQEDLSAGRLRILFEVRDTGIGIPPEKPIRLRHGNMAAPVWA